MKSENTPSGHSIRKPLGYIVLLFALIIMARVLYSNIFDINFLLRYFQIINRYDWDLMPTNAAQLSKDEARALIYKAKLSLDAEDFQGFFYKKKWNTLKTMIRAGFDPNEKLGNNGTPFQMACREGNIPFVEFLLSQGANVNAFENGTTPLHIAAEINSEPIVELLLKAGAKATPVNEMGETALMFGVENASPGIVRRLLSAGADPNDIYFYTEESLYDYALDHQNFNIADLLKSAGAVSFKQLPYEKIEEYRPGKYISSPIPHLEEQDLGGLKIGYADVELPIGYEVLLGQSISDELSIEVANYKDKKILMLTRLEGYSGQKAISKIMDVIVLPPMKSGEIVMAYCNNEEAKRPFTIGIGRYENYEEKTPNIVRYAWQLNSEKIKMEEISPVGVECHNPVSCD